MGHLSQLVFSLKIQFMGWTSVCRVRFRNLGLGLGIYIFNKHPQVTLMSGILSQYFEKHCNGIYNIKEQLQSVSWFNK